MNRSRFERLDETTGQADRHHIAIPASAAHAGDKLDLARVGQGLAIQISKQRRCGLIFADEFAGEHMAIANAMLQRDAPLPTG